MNPDVAAKIERALEHRDALQAAQVDSRELRPHRLRFENNNTEDTNPICWAQWRVDDPGEPLPLTMGLILGDLVHNLRSALDYSAFVAATEDARSNHPRDLMFPIYAERRGFTQKASTMRRLYPAEIVELFEQSQPYRAPNTHLAPLGVLQSLSNGDKHRVLQVVRRAQIFVGDVTIDPAPSAGVTSIIGEGPIVKDAVVARIEYPRPPSAREIDVRANIAWYEAVGYVHDGTERWLRIDEMFNAVCPEVVDVVAAMDYTLTHLV